jgi:hypothetical protein
MPAFEPPDDIIQKKGTRNPLVLVGACVSLVVVVA